MRRLELTRAAKDLLFFGTASGRFGAAGIPRSFFNHPGSYQDGPRPNQR